MKTFDDLEFIPHIMGVGIMSSTQFDNGYGASVIKSPYSYGGNQGLYELAVLNSEGELIYSTPITDDVIGWLRPEDVTDLLKQIQQL